MKIKYTIILCNLSTYMVTLYHIIHPIYRDVVSINFDEQWGLSTDICTSHGASSGWQSLFWEVPMVEKGSCKAALCSLAQIPFQNVPTPFTGWNAADKRESRAIETVIMINL